MEESVALDSSKQKEFVKSVRGIKKLLKKQIKKGPVVSKKKSVEKADKKTEKSNRKKVKNHRNRGLVYLAHIPHGFYEHQMTEYFKQFGAVTNVRVIRSKRTGASKGYAFVEFKEPSVAEIVAETMNNYLMGKRLIKAVYIPPEKQKMHAQRKNWNSQMNPAYEQRLKIKKAFNADKTDVMELTIARKLLSNLLKTKSKLNELGIDYDFMPVDIPEELQSEVEKINCSVKEVSSSDIKINNKIKGEDVKSNKAEKKIKNELEELNVVITKSKKKRNKKNKKSEIVKETEDKKTVTVDTDKVEKDKKKVKKEPKLKAVTVDTDKVEKDKKKVKKEPKLKQNKIKVDNIKPLQNFVSIKQDSESDDEFDSEAFERMMADDDDDLSSGDEFSDGDDESDGEEEIIEQPKREFAKRKAIKGNEKKPIPALKKDNSAPVMKAKVGKVSAMGAAKNVKKRKNIESTSLPPKKAKFEKQHKKAMKKVIKKKK